VRVTALYRFRGGELFICLGEFAQVAEGITSHQRSLPQNRRRHPGRRLRLCQLQSNRRIPFASLGICPENPKLPVKFREIARVGKSAFSGFQWLVGIALEKLKLGLLVLAFQRGPAVSFTPRNEKREREEGGPGR
jgi:hypothetical protein